MCSNLGIGSVGTYCLIFVQKNEKYLRSMYSNCKNTCGYQKRKICNSEFLKMIIGKYKCDVIPLFSLQYFI